MQREQTAKYCISQFALKVKYLKFYFINRYLIVIRSFIKSSFFYIVLVTLFKIFVLYKWNIIIIIMFYLYKTKVEFYSTLSVKTFHVK